MAALALLSLTGCTTTHSHVSTAQYLPVRTVRVAQPIQVVQPLQTVPSVPSGAVSHTVRGGETLWSIAKCYGVSVDQLADANGITDTSSIEKGRVLAIPGISRQPKRVNYISRTPGPFIWPVKGTVVSQFGEKVDKAANKGIDIRAQQGAGVLASKDGKVVFVDSQLKGFGETVIVDHLDGYQTVYSYNSEILARVGDAVRQGQTIARVGSSGRAKEPMLHFEIRKNGEPQNPESYLKR